MIALLHVKCGRDLAGKFNLLYTSYAGTRVGTKKRLKPYSAPSISHFSAFIMQWLLINLYPYIIMYSIQPAETIEFLLLCGANPNAEYTEANR